MKTRVTIDSMEFEKWDERVELNLKDGYDVILENFHRGFHEDKCLALAKTYDYLSQVDCSDPQKIEFRFFKCSD